MSDTFISELVTYLHTHSLMPEIVTSADTDREKTYLFELPKDPSNVFVINPYLTRHASLTPKDVGVQYIQIIVRNTSQKTAYDSIFAIYNFLLNRDEFIEYINPTRWVIFDIMEGPIKIQIDEQGRHIWGLSFPVKTSC